VQHDASPSLLRPVVIAGATATTLAIFLVVQWRLSIDGDIGIGGVQQRRVIDQARQSADGRSSGVVT
jgi:hypothetical protein